MSDDLKAYVSPSLLQFADKDVAHLTKECDKVVDAWCEWLHFDVQDGSFVKDKSFPASLVKDLRAKLPKKDQRKDGKGQKYFLDCHLMVSDPKKAVADYAAAGADMLTFHWEAVGGKTDEAVALGKEVTKHGIRAGLAVKPGTPIKDVFPALDAKGVFSMVLIMTAEPGKADKQKFMKDMLDKVKAARARYPALDIQVSGAIDKETSFEAANAGANVIVSGTAIFDSKNIKDTIESMRGDVNGVLEPYEPEMD